MYFILALVFFVIYERTEKKAFSVLSSLAEIEPKYTEFILGNSIYKLGIKKAGIHNFFQNIIWGDLIKFLESSENKDVLINFQKLNKIRIVSLSLFVIFIIIQLVV